MVVIKSKSTTFGNTYFVKAMSKVRPGQTQQGQDRKSKGNTGVKSGVKSSL